MATRKWPPPALSRTSARASFAWTPSRRRPVQSGCGCRRRRSDTAGGLAHVGCLIESAVAQQPLQGNAVWSRWKCQTCGQFSTWAMRTGLGADSEAWWSRVYDEEEESELEERLAAASNLADAVAVARAVGKQYAAAERIQREVLGVQRYPQSNIA
jgi:hypothetical protein